MSFDGWLDARDTASVEREWATLGAKHVEIGTSAPHYLCVRPEGAALLAARVLACSPERFAWFAAERYADPPRWPAPTFHQGREVSRSFFDQEFAVDEPGCTEVLTIRETIDGPRGVQHVTIDCAWGEMTREGGNGRSSTFVRVFDRSTRRAVSIPLYATGVWMVGDVDLAPLDLFSRRTEFKLPWKTYDPDALRGLFAQLATHVDAHFDTCATWPGGLTEDKVIDDREYNFRIRQRTCRFEAAPFAIELAELLDPDGTKETGWLTATIHGLPWGHAMRWRIDSTDDPTWGVSGWVDVMLPRAQLDTTLAALAAIPGIQIA